MFNEDFWNLKEDKYYKYLDIAKGIMSTKVNDNMLSLDLLPFNIAYDGIDRLIETDMKDEAALAAVVIQQEIDHTNGIII